MTNSILREFKFGAKKLFEKLPKINAQFDLTFEFEDLGKFFELIKKSFNLKIMN